MNTTGTLKSLVFVILIVAIMSLFPLVGDKFYTQLLTKIMIAAIFAISLDLLVGVVGLISLGHAAFFGLSGYVVALVSQQFEVVNFFVAIAISVGACALFAVVTGLLVLRTSGFYFIMATLAFAQMLFFVFHDTALGGGGDGIYIYTKPEFTIGSVSLLNIENASVFYWLVLGTLATVYLFIKKLLRSNFGHALIGIKVNSHRMTALGYPVLHYKLAAYVLSGSIAGIAGYFSALQFGFVSPEVLSWHSSANVLVMVILGGMGTIAGPVLGASVFILLQEFISNDTIFGVVSKHWQLVVGFFIIFVSLVLPNGLAGLFARRKIK